MRYLFRAGILNSNSYATLLSSDVHNSRMAQLVYLSVLSKNTLRNSQKVKNQKETQGYGPLFNEILGIIGAEDISLDKHDTYGFFTSQKTILKGSVVSSQPLQSVCQNADQNILLESACGNAEEKVETESLSISGNKENGFTDGTELEDVSPIVHEVSGIVRGENKMEERLDGADIEYSEEVVDKVLKRCFKVPHLALRFFNWVKSRKGFEHTTNTFNTMINVAGEVKELNMVEELVEDMEKSYCDKNVKTWTLLVSHYGRAKMIGKALMVFEKMKKAGIQPDAVAYRIMLRSLCNARKSEVALEFYKEMIHNEVEIDLGLYKQLLKCFAQCGDTASVYLVGDQMLRVSVIPELSVYVLMLKSFCITGKIRDALELIRSMKNKDINFNSETFETLVEGFCRANRTEDAMELMEMMRKRNIFCCKAYEVLIKAFLRRNEVSHAFDLFQEIKDSADISQSTYTNVMEHLFSNSEFQKGMELYNKLVEMGVQLDSAVITAVSAGYIKQNRIREAWQIFKSMDENGTKATSKECTVFIKELCKVPKTDELAKVVNEMQASELNFQADVFKQVQSYLVKKGETQTFNPRDEVKPIDSQHDRPEPTEKSFLESSASRSCHNHVQEICQILSSSTDWCVIQQKLEKFYFQFTPDLVVEILRSCRQNGGTTLKFFSWVGKQSAYSHNAQSYNMAMKIAGQGKDFKHMRSLFHEMRRKGCSITSDTWTIIIMQYGRTGLTDIALNKFREMKVSGCKPTKSTYSSLITSLCGKKGRKVDEAIRVYQEMVREGWVPDKELVETYVGCLCEVNKLSDVRGCIDSLPKFGYSVPLTYSLYFRALCRAGKLDEALALTDEVGDQKNILDQYTYGSLIHVFLRKGRLEEALAKMDSMKEIGIYPTVHVYTDLIIHYFKAKEIDKASEILEEMKAQDCQPTIITYSAVICGYVRSGRVTDAWKVFHGLKENGPLPDFKTYSMFIECLCTIGKSEEALGLIHEMTYSGIVPSTINFKKIIYGLNREGKQNLAKVVLKKKLDLKQRRKMHLED